MNLLDNAAYQAAGPPKKKPAPKALPGNLRTHENRAAARNAPPRALPGNARVADQQAAAMQANLANLPPALSREDRMSIIQQAATAAGTAHGYVVADAARKLGVDGIRDDAKLTLLQQVARALNLSVSPANILGTLRTAATGDLTTSAALGLNPLAGLVANQQGWIPELGGSQRGSQQQRSEAGRAKVQAILEALGPEVLARQGFTMAQTEQTRQRARTLPGTYDVASSGSARPGTLDPNELHELAVAADQAASRSNAKGRVYYVALARVARRASQRQTRPTVDQLYEQMWRAAVQAGMATPAR